MRGEQKMRVAADFMSYLFPVSSFLFFDASQSLIKHIADSISVMTLFALLGHQATRLIQNEYRKKEKSI